MMSHTRDCQPVAVDQPGYGQGYAALSGKGRMPRVLVPAPCKPGDTPLLRERVSHPSMPGSAVWRSRCRYPRWCDMPVEMRGQLMTRGYTESIYNSNSWMIRGLDPDDIYRSDRVGFFTVLEVRKDDNRVVLQCDCGSVSVKNLDYFASRLPLMCRSACLSKIVRESQVA